MIERALNGSNVKLSAGPCRIDVEGASPADLHRIIRQIGAERAEADEVADLHLRFKPLPATPRRLFGAAEYAADGDELILLRGYGKRSAEVGIPFDRLGEAPTLRCAPGSTPVPLLVPLVNLIASSKEILPLHAAAFVLEGLGVLVTGWSKSGKTETLLTFAGQGARYLGDEWVYLHPGGLMSGLPEPMRVWSWHLRELGHRAPRLPLRTRAGLAALDVAVTGGSELDERLPGWMRRLRFLAAKQRNVRLPPQRLLPVAERGNLDVVVLTESHDRDEIIVEPIDVEEVASRAATMLPVERAPLLEAYDVYRYAFPGRRCDLIDTAPERERSLLSERLAGRPALLVRHPYPFRFEAMARALRPHLEALRADAARPEGPVLTPSRATMHVPQDVLVQRLPDDESVFLNLSTEEYYGLDAIGTAMWAALTETGTTERALERLVEEFRIDPEVLHRDLHALVVRLEARGLIRTGDAPARPAR